MLGCATIVVAGTQNGSCCIELHNHHHNYVNPGCQRMVSCLHLFLDQSDAFCLTDKQFVATDRAPERRGAQRRSYDSM